MAVPEFTVVIPARFGSARLPGKPLLDIAGQPMIRHVWSRACRSAATRVVVATDDERIAEAVVTFTSDVIMTRADHASGTDRVEEVARHLGLKDQAIVVNVQGDEPLIPPAVIDQVAANLASHPSAGVATLCELIERPEELWSSSAVKVVMDQAGRALYFSRAPIPWYRDEYELGRMPQHLADDVALLPWRHLGIYAYRVATLRDFVGWRQVPVERLEGLEQLRMLWHGVSIHVAPTAQRVPAGVDTAEDLARVRGILGAPDSP